MSDLFSPDQARERSLRLAFEDGVEEIYLGLFALVMGGVYLVSFTLPRGSTLSQIMAFGASFFQIVFILAMVALRKKVKAAYVFPRTGYVVFRRGKWEQWMVWAFGLSALAIGVAATFWRSLLPDLTHLAGPVAAAGMAGGFLWAGLAYKYPHLLWLGGIATLLGVATYVADAKAAGMLWVLLGVGSALAFSGSLRFRSFLKTHPILEGFHD